MFTKEEEISLREIAFKLNICTEVVFKNTEGVSESKQRDIMGIFLEIMYVTEIIDDNDIKFGLEKIKEMKL